MFKFAYAGITQEVEDAIKRIESNIIPSHKFAIRKEEKDINKIFRLTSNLPKQYITVILLNSGKFVLLGNTRLGKDGINLGVFQVQIDELDKLAKKKLIYQEDVDTLKKYKKDSLIEDDFEELKREVKVYSLKYKMDQSKVLTKLRKSLNASQN